MEESDEALPASGRHIKKAKSFGWKVVTFIFGLLFIASIALCILFATGIITIEESEDGRSFVFASPLAKDNDEPETLEPAPVETPEKEEQPQKAETPSESKPSETSDNAFAAYDFKIDELIGSAKAIYTDSQVYVDDLRATTNGDYLVARLYVGSGNYGDAKFYYRSTTSDSEWILINAMGSQAAPLCEDMSELERKIIRESYPEKNSCRHEDGSFENL